MNGMQQRRLCRTPISICRTCGAAAWVRIRSGPYMCEDCRTDYSPQVLGRETPEQCRSTFRYTGVIDSYFQ